MYMYRGEKQSPKSDKSPTNYIYRCSKHIFNILKFIYAHFCQVWKYAVMLWRGYLEVKLSLCLEPRNC